MNNNQQTGSSVYSNNTVNTNPQYGNNNQIQAQNIRYATFGKRLGAFIRDSLPMLLISIILFYIMTFLRIYLTTSGMEGSLLYKILQIIGIAAPILIIMCGQPIYSLFGDASSKHATKGKLKRNMYVLDSQGNYLTFGQSFLRTMMKYISISFPVCIFVSIITMCCTEKNKQYMI